MKALALKTRHDRGGRRGDACLLVYDTPTLTSSTVSSDVRDVLSRRPNTPWIYVLCPFLPARTAHTLALGGTAVDRSNSLISVVQLVQGAGGSWKLQHQEPDETTHELDAELVHGWLFDLFDRRGGLVRAPLGVHFAKLSGQHTDSFLRASSTLLSSAEIGAVAFFCQALLGNAGYSRVFVDTASLIGVAFAMTRVARACGIGVTDPAVESYSSYGGINKLPTLGSTDLCLISASTSGSLAKELLTRGAKANLVLTLFLLGPKVGEDTHGLVVCNLTNTSNRSFGYAPISNAVAKDCLHCRRGSLAAPLEGDQFLLEKRDVTRMRVSTASQPRQAREVTDALARTGLLSVETMTPGERTDVRLDLKTALAEVPNIEDKAIRLVRRFTPLPLTYVLLVDIEKSNWIDFVAKAELSREFQNAQVYSHAELAAIPVTDNARVLVMIGFLDDHAKIRSINAQMRVKAPNGEVSYLSVFTAIDSAQSLRELEMFLSYGARGQDTFTFKSALALMLPNKDKVPTSWAQELELLQRMKSEHEERFAAKLQARLVVLLGPSLRADALFLPGLRDELRIAADFVYLDTGGNRELVTHADVYAIISNLLATVRCNNVGLATPAGKLPGKIEKNQNVYGQLLVCPAALCPRNLRDYNDSILRAALLRAAHPQELNYAVDAQCSSEILAILRAEIDAWSSGHGDATPEILMSLATGRLQLTPDDLESFIGECKNTLMDDWAQQLLEVIENEVLQGQVA